MGGEPALVIQRFGEEQRGVEEEHRGCGGDAGGEVEKHGGLGPEGGDQCDPAQRAG